MFRYLFLFLLWPAAQAQAPDGSPEKTQNVFPGAWQNERGSIAVFEIEETSLSGYYQTHAGRPDKSQKFSLTGFAQGDQITFTVNFKGYGSMTSWTGQLTEDENGPYIRTLWHLTRDVQDAEEYKDLWKSITSGASDFRPFKPQN